MKYLIKFNIYRNTSDFPLMIYHILSIVNPITRSVISNTDINLGKMKPKDFENDVSLANEKSKGWMK